jgi:hypothetical protein
MVRTIYNLQILRFYPRSQCPLTPLGSEAGVDSVGCDGSGGNGGDEAGVAGRLAALAPFVEGRTIWGDNIGCGEAGRGGAGEFGRDVGASEGEMLLADS